MFGKMSQVTMPVTSPVMSMTSMMALDPYFSSSIGPSRSRYIMLPM